MREKKRVSNSKMPLTFLLVFVTFAFAFVPSTVLATPNLQYFNFRKVIGINSITVDFDITNYGSDMTASWLVEMQPRPSGLLPMGFLPQEVCDPSHPENVHRDFTIPATQSVHITLTSTVNPGTYDVYLLSRNKCWATAPQGNTQTPPFASPYEFMGSAIVSGSSITTTTIQTTTTTISSSSPNVIATQYPTATVSGKQITVAFKLKNTGTDMATTWLVEMQPRPHGLLPMRFYPQEVCDATHPENVHVDFQLASGEENTITLTSTVSDGIYDVWMLTGDKCWSVAPTGNVKVAPFPDGYKIANVVVGNSIDGIQLPFELPLPLTYIAMIVGVGLTLFGWFWIKENG